MTDLAALVVSEEELAGRVRELGAEISGDYAGRLPVLVGMLNGSLPFLADLVRAIDIPIEVDFLALSPFGEGRRVRIAADTETALTGRDVLVVDGLVDTGLSLASALRLIEPRMCRSVATVTLFDKAPRRIAEVQLEYRGYEVGDEFLIGYGMDYQGWFRNLASVWAVLDLEAMTSDVANFASNAFNWASDSLKP